MNAPFRTFKPQAAVTCVVSTPCGDVTPDCHEASGPFSAKMHTETSRPHRTSCESIEVSPDHPLKVRQLYAPHQWMKLLPNDVIASVSAAANGLFACRITNAKGRTAGTMCGSVEAGFEWCKDMLGRWDRNEVIA